MKEFYFSLTIIACSVLMLSTSPSQAATRTSSTDGNWSSTGTWGGDAVPGSGDDVVIAGGTTVTIDDYAFCRNLTIDNAAVLQFADVTTYYVLAVSGDVEVDGTLLAAATASNGGSDGIYISGNLEISGIYTDAITGRYINTEMKGAGKGINALNFDFKGNLYIDVPGGSITVDNPFYITGSLTLNEGTLDNSTHNITINSNASINRRNSTALLAVAPTFVGTNQILDYYGTMITGVELPDNVYQIYVSIYSGGSVTLNKNVTVSNLIGFDYSNCELITGANTITLTNGSPAGISQPDNTSYIVGNLARAYSGSPSSKSFPIGSATAYRPVTVNVTSLTGGGTITVSETDAAPASSSLPSGVNKISSVRYWTLSKSAGITAVTADVTLSWGSDDGVSNPAEITVVQGDHSTGNWDVASGTGSGTASSGTVTGTGFTSFSDFTLGTTGSDNPLAVEATSFVAKADVESVTLTWQTQSEVDNAGFNILRQDAGTNLFIPIASYTSNDALKGMGTSATGRNYSFTDTKVKSGLTYQYKVQSVSTNGTTKDLTTLSVTVDIPKTYALYQNYPNPFNPSTTIQFDLKQTSTVVLAIYNVLGQRVEEWNYGAMDAGRYNENVNLDALASGVYFYKLVASGVEPTAVGNDGQKFTATKKLLLMK